MKLVAKRVRLSMPRRTVTSASAGPACSVTRSRTRSAVVAGSLVDEFPPADPDPAEAGRDRRMTGVADLLGLALAAVRSPPERPLVRPAEHVERAPEPRADRRVRRVLEQPAPLTALDLPTDLAAELEVQPLVVVRPGAVRIHQDPVVGGRDHRVERVAARQQPDVRHPDHRDPVEAFRP